jgi:pimeloyl-ACP methyl ester carboxylesterase
VKHWLTALALLLPALALAAPPAAHESTSVNCVSRSAGLLHDLTAGHFTAATEHFDRRMKAALGALKLKRVWRQALPSRFGDFERAGKPKPKREGGHDVVITPLRFANGRLNMAVTCNSKHAIAGLFFRPAPSGSAAGSTLESLSDWMQATGVGAKTLPVMVKRSGFALKGVVDLPAGKGPFPVVDIIPGSGPVDLNGNAHGIAYSPYKKLARALVNAGWAVARVAKRGLPPSTGDGNDVVFANQVADNLAVVKALRKNRHIQSNAIVVAGHSIGGLIAPKLATQTHLAGLILLEAPGENVKKLLNTQTIAIAKHSGADKSKIAALKQNRKKLYRKLKDAPAGRSVTVGGKTIPANQVALIESWIEQDPLATARKVKAPVLVVQGGMDFNVPPGNGKRLADAFAHAKLLKLPTMGHALDVAHCRCRRQLNAGKDSTLAPWLVDGIVTWLKSLNG